MIIPIISQLSPDAPLVSRSNLEVPVDHPMATFNCTLDWILKGGPRHCLGAKGPVSSPNNLDFDLGKMMKIWWKCHTNETLPHNVTEDFWMFERFFQNHWGHFSENPRVHPCWTIWFAKLKHHREKHRYYGPINHLICLYIYMTIFCMHAALLGKNRYMKKDSCMKIS